MDSETETKVTNLDDLVNIPKKRGHDCVVIIYSSNPRQFGKRHVLGQGKVTMGRGADNTIVLENDSVSRQHCRVESRNGGYVMVDLNSTNGTYVNDELMVGGVDGKYAEMPLRRGDHIKVGDTILKFLSGSDMEAQYHETIYNMTIVDGLTGVNNKRYLLETLEREIPRARRHNRPLSMIIFDIDHFKQVNDTYGHLAGDYVLKEMAQLIKSRIRPDDTLGRYGGEEFVVVLPETDKPGAVHIAEEIRKLVASHAFTFERERMSVSISIGVALLRDSDAVDDLIAAADERLYAAKNGGRNRVCY